MINKTPLSAVIAATAAILEEEEGIFAPDAPVGEEVATDDGKQTSDPIVLTTLSGGLEKLRIPFKLWDSAVEPVPREIASQLENKPLAPMMPIVWQREDYLVATVSYDGIVIGSPIPVGVVFSALAIVRAVRIDLNE